MSANLELVTLYTYKNYFLLEAHPSVTRVRTNLLIERKSLKIQ